ncbi:MAG: HAMP domain-containing protein, partial [Acidobacteriota bacterium]|nr:HAMP domain-containing protein [Acidobacteriota bacterium]
MVTGTGASRSFTPSLGTRIFLVTLLLVALAVGSAVAVSSVLIQRIARKAVKDALASSSTMQRTFQHQLYERLRTVAKVLTSDPYLKAYMAEAAGQRDIRSILDALEERRKDLGPAFVLVLDPAGRVVANSESPTATGLDYSRRPLVAREMKSLKQEDWAVWREPEDLYYAVIVPLSSQDFTLLGFLVTGFRVSDLVSDLAAQSRADQSQISELSGADLAILATGKEPPRVLSTTLPADMQQSLNASLRKNEALRKALAATTRSADIELLLAGEPWIASVSPLLDAAGQPAGAMIALASLERELAAYHRIEGVLVGAGLLAVVLVPLLALVLTRQTLAPMRRLVTSTEAARQGNFDQKIALDRSDEVGKLATAFDELLAELREKRDMEAYVTELSRNLPEPAQGRLLLGLPQRREALLLGLELRGYARLAGEATAEQVLARFESELKQVAGAITAAGGQVQA